MKTITQRLIHGLSIISLTATVTALCAVTASAEGMCTETALTSTDEKVTVNETEDCIYVSPHPTRTDSFISSEMLTTSCLSSRKYNLTYVDENMEEAETDNVLDGYVKAEYKREGGETYYIPIKVYESEEAEYSFIDDMYVPLSGGSTASAKTALGGRASDVSADVLTPPESGLTEWDSMQHNFSSITLDDAAMDNSKTFTVEFNAYAEGDTILRVNCDYSGDTNVFMRWLADGTVEANVDGTLTALTTAEREEWHRIAVNYDSVRKRYSLFIDGELVTDTSPYWTGGARMSYGIDTGSSTGFGAFSDLKYYYGYYYPSLYYTPAGIESTNENIIIEDTSIYVNEDGIKSIDEIKKTVSTDAAYISIIGSTVSEGTKIVTETLDNIVGYYRIKSPLSCDGVNFTVSDGTVTAEATVNNKLSSDASAVMIMVQKDENGVITNVSASEKMEISSDGTAFIIENIPETGSIREVFFITGWESRLGLFNKIYSE